MISDSSKFVRRVLRIFGVIAVISACLLLLYNLTGCGKAGMPVPKDESRSFAWESAEASMAGRCIAFKAQLSGAYRYFDGIRLEIGTLNGPEDCPGCPFVPTEVTELSPRDVGFNAKDGSLGFSYCPQTANAYRWKLAAISVFNRVPHATMTDRFLVASDPEIWLESDAAPGQNATPGQDDIPGQDGAPVQGSDAAQE